MERAFEPIARDAPSVQPSAQAAVSWPAVIAGAFVATAISVVLLTLGSGLGFAALSPWPGRGVSVTTFAVSSAIWLIVTQWISSGVGGYIAGRLRTRWISTHTHEVFFRDTAHGLITWAVATVLVASVFASSMLSLGNRDAVLSQAPATLHMPQADSVPQAERRIDEPAVDPADVDAARKAASEAAIYVALSMLLGAFIASVSAALGGRLRDEHP
jgi:hypothetical protein